MNELMLSFAVGFALAVSSKRVRRMILIVAFGVPCMLIGYAFGYIQAGFMTGYRIYNKESE